MIGDNFDLDGFLKELEELPYDENSDFDTKRIGDRVVLLDIAFASGINRESLTNADVEDVKYFVVIDESQTYKLAANGRVSNLDIVIANPTTKKIYRTTSYKVRLFS